MNIEPIDNPIQHLEKDELLDVLREAKARSTRDHALILLGYQHACRASELSNLRLTDLNWRDETIDVKRLKGSLRTVQTIFQHRGQPLLDEKGVLKAWLRERPEDGSDFVFVSRKGGRLGRRQITRMFKDVAQAASEKRVARGFKPIPESVQHVHTLKHSRVSHMAGKMDLALLRQLAGHKSIKSTMKYLHASDRDACKEAQRVAMELF